MDGSPTDVNAVNLHFVENWFYALSCAMVHANCWHFEDQVGNSEEEDSRICHCQSLTSGGIFDTWSGSQFFQTCGRSGSSCGQFGDPLGQLKQQVSTWRLTWDCKLPIGELRQCASLQKNHCDPFSEGTPTLPPLLPKTNLTIQGWLTADSSRPFPIANLTCLTRRWGVWYYWLFSRHCYKMHLQCQVSKTVFLRSRRIPRSQDIADFVLGCW